MTLKEAALILEKAGIDEPLSEARMIFSELSGLKQYELISGNASTESQKVKEAIERRAKREPMQYILGRAYFYRECYKVTPDVLIPREDTEILVDYAVKNLKKGCRFLDLCTGSGCIALSVLNNTENTTAVAVDISEGAIGIAKENAGLLGLSDRVEFVVSDATEPLDRGDFFAVLSNPPYVSQKAYQGLEKEIFFEPPSAFLGGEDGCDFYKKITPVYRDIIDDDGFIAYEIGYDQGESLKRIADENQMSCTILKDLSGNDRVALLKKIT